MTRRRRLLFVALVAAQALLPLSLIARNEQALASGTRVTLSYEISALPTPYDAGTTVYVPLTDGGETWLGGTPTDARPQEGTFIRGYVSPSGRIEFGIGRYFTDEDEAQRLEAAGPLLVDVALSDDGVARIAGVRPVR